MAFQKLKKVIFGDLAGFCLETWLFFVRRVGKYQFVYLATICSAFWLNQDGYTFPDSMNYLYLNRRTPTKEATEKIATPFSKGKQRNHLSIPCILAIISLLCGTVLLHIAIAVA